jgi:hypothetical protein
LVSVMILAGNCSISFCSFIDGIGGLIPIFHQLFVMKQQ